MFQPEPRNRSLLVGTATFQLTLCQTFERFTASALVGNVVRQWFRGGWSEKTLRVGRERKVGSGRSTLQEARIGDLSVEGARRRTSTAAYRCNQDAVSQPRLAQVTWRILSLGQRLTHAILATN